MAKGRRGSGNLLDEHFVRCRTLIRVACGLVPLWSAARGLVMAEESEPTRSKFRALGIVLGALTAGVVDAFYSDLRAGIAGAPYGAGGGSDWR
jgi:hypothetical protein